jgi:hypothetical protein
MRHHPPTLRRRAATAFVVVALALSVAPREARADWISLSSNNKTSDGIWLTVIGLGLGAGDAAAIYAVVQGGFCTAGPNRDDVKCGFSATGLALLTAASALCLGTGIAMIAIDQQTPPAARRVSGPSLLGPRRPAALELRVEPHGVVLRGVF